MSPTPARCTHCGHEWVAAGLIESEFDVNDLTLTGGSTRCPKCHRMGQLLEGRFNLRSGGIEVLEGPQWTWDLVESLNLTLRQVVQRPPPNPVAAVAATSPELADMIKVAVEEGLERSSTKRTSKHRRRLVLRVIAAIIGVVSFDYTNTGQNLGAVKTAVEAILRHVAQHGALPPPWG